MKTKLAKGRTFTKPNARLSRIWELLDEDMICSFCDSYFFEEVAKVMEYGEYSPEEKRKQK